MKTKLTILLLTLTILCGCHIKTPEEQAIGELLKTFIAAVEKGDETMAKAILMDMETFRTLNPDASARLDADNFSEVAIAECIHNFREMVDYFKGRTLRIKSFQIGDVWYQYKGRQAFKDTEVFLDADGESVGITIRGLVRMGDRWRIVDLSGNEFN